MIIFLRFETFESLPARLRYFIEGLSAFISHEQMLVLSVANPAQAHAPCLTVFSTSITQPLSICNAVNIQIEQLVKAE